MMELTKSMELIRAQLLDLADLHLAELFADLLDLRDFDEMSLELMAGTWLMRRKMQWLLDQDDEEIFEDEELDRVLEGVLLDMVEKTIYASASRAMRTRMEDAAASLPVALEAVDLVPAVDDAIVLPSRELGEAIARALERATVAADVSPTPLSRSSVDVVAIGLAFLAKLEQTSSFAQMIAGIDDIEVIVSFVILLEAHAFGAVVVRQVGADIEVDVIDGERLGLVTEMVRTLG